MRRKRIKQITWYVRSSKVHGNLQSQYAYRNAYETYSWFHSEKLYRTEGVESSTK